MEQLERGHFGESAALDPAKLPARSLPVHPTQIYSAIDAALLCWLLWSYYPFRRRDGEVAALMLTLHPISRFLLEIIRVDEPAVFGTDFSISQNISIVLFVLTLVGWALLLLQPPHRASFRAPVPA
jgi:phosphatidylglycerol:prolipoprotein diacylglycerol transferase